MGTATKEAKAKVPAAAKRRATLIKRLSGQQRVLPLPAVLREAGL